MTRAARLQTILSSHFAPAKVDVLDESHKHIGHIGASPQGETHYRVAVVSPKFSGKSRIERHRLVNNAVKAEFDMGLHALQLILKTPEE